ncbi:MAG: hypothetical protein WKF52_04720 [Sphingomicrobium sp.]
MTALWSDIEGDELADLQRLGALDPAALFRKVGDDDLDLAAVAQLRSGRPESPRHGRPSKSILAIVDEVHPTVREDD